MTFLTALITGLTTGGLTCLAVQGGLLFGLLAKRHQKEEGENLSGWQRLVLPVTGFMVAKIIAYTILGLGLGWLGSKIQLTSTMRIWLQVLSGLFLLITGIRLFFPRWLPWLTIVPPVSVRRLVRRSARSQAMAAPALLGVLTVLIPCGTTQAMEVAAVATGTPLQAAAIMFGFTLGTAPLFFIVGILARGSALFQQRLKFAAATVVIVLGLFTLNGVLVSIDSPYSFQNEVTAFQRVFLGGDSATQVSPAQQDVKIAVLANGYVPDTITVPAGQSIRFSLNTKGNYGCTSVFRIPKLKIEETLPASGSTQLTATFPTPGQYTFTCGMGMYSGIITAV